MIELARAFVLVVVGPSVLWSWNQEALLGLLVLAATFTCCTVLMRRRLIQPWMLWAEAAVVASVAPLAAQSSAALLAFLPLPLFIHGLMRGYRGVAESLGVYLVVLSGVLAAAPPTHAPPPDLFMWLATGLGLGLISAFFSREEADVSTRAYLEARDLLAELTPLADRLDEGLDPSVLGVEILDAISAELPFESALLHVQRDGELVALAQTVVQPSSPPPADCAELAEATWQDGRARVVERNFAFRLSHGRVPIALASGRLPETSTSPHEIVACLDQLSRQLAPQALRLDTAQLFAAFRDAAMSEERRRLAREMHDGMAQDIASMGYVVDALLSTATPTQEQALVQLRSMITRVVAEVRRSVMTLRTQAGSSESLGAAIATLARHLSDVSGIPIKVTVDERTSRLRHEVEAELLRIAQEAMNNAIKHSRAALVDVHCHVQAPYAEIVVSDDGLGLQAGRRDSHGLSIMRERARLIGGELEVRSSPDRGTRVSVRVGQKTLESPTSPPLPHAPALANVSSRS